MKHMMRKSFAGALLAAGIAAVPTSASVGGKFYGVHWDGSQEHFVTLDPVTGVHTSLGVVPGVQWIDVTFRVFDPDSGLFAFIGGSSNAMNYQVIDAATGTVTHSFPRNDNLKNPSYDPGTGLLYGTWWSDSTPVAQDSIGGHPVPVHPVGTEYFSSIDPRTGARTDTPIPGVWAIGAGSQFLDTDSGRYVFQGIDTGGTSSYYVIDVETGTLLAQMPLEMKLDFPVYNPLLGAVHGLWWSDSTERDSLRFDTLGHPIPIGPPDIRGTEYFVTVFQDSTVEMVELPGVKYISNFNRTLDTDSGRYVFTGRDTSAAGIRYYVIDVNTGAILSNAVAPGRAVDHIVYAPLASETYTGSAVSLSSDHAGRGGAWALRQTAGRVELEFANAGDMAHAFALVDMTGKVVLRRDGIRGGRVNFATGGLKAGLYAFTLRNAEGRAVSGKIILK